MVEWVEIFGDNNLEFEPYVVVDSGKALKNFFVIVLEMHYATSIGNSKSGANHFQINSCSNLDDWSSFWKQIDQMG